MTPFAELDASSNRPERPGAAYARVGHKIVDEFDSPLGCNRLDIIIEEANKFAARMANPKIEFLGQIECGRFIVHQDESRNSLKRLLLLVAQIAVVNDDILSIGVEGSLFEALHALGHKIDVLTADLSGAAAGRNNIGEEGRRGR